MQATVARNPRRSPGGSQQKISKVGHGEEMLLVPVVDERDGTSYSPWGKSIGDIVDATQLRKNAEQFASGPAQAIDTPTEVSVSIAFIRIFSFHSYFELEADFF